MTSAVRRWLIALTCLALAGCGSGADLKESLGLTHQGPDEYRVVPRPPLSVPPEFSLRPPGTQDSTYVSGKAAQARAHDEVLGLSDAAPSAAGGGADASVATAAAVTPVTSGDLASGADAQFLADAGGSKTDPQIRQKLMSEKWNTTTSGDPNYLFGGKQQSDSVVDATKEADRLKADKAQNQPPTTGETPTVPAPDKGLLGDIF